MAPPRLVFSDLDDTLVARDKSVPAGNLAALDLLLSHGVGFVPCTGRTVWGVPAEVLAHPATRFVVGSNGGMVIDARTGETLRRSVMGVGVVVRVYERVSHLNITFDAFMGGHILAERSRYEAMEGFGIDEANLAVVRSLREPHDATIPELIAGADGVEKVTIYWSSEGTRDELRAALAEFPEIEVTTSHPKNFEFMAAGTSKGTALRWICAHLGIDVAETVAFGDSANDLAMIVAAGDGVAVGNAQQAVLDVADHVCGDCDDAGVGKYLRSIL